MTTHPARSDAFAQGTPVRLWEDGFALDPHAYYAALRAQGPIGWAELAPGQSAYVVTDRRAALDLLHDTGSFSVDPRPWERTVPEDSQLLSMMRWRPNCLFADGGEHIRYRQTLLDAFDLVEPHDLRERVHRSVDILVSRFGPDGEADLVRQFARPLMTLVLNNLFGLPDSESGRLEAALGLMMEGGEESAAGEAEYGKYVMELIAVKSARRGDDLPSRLLDHPLRLTPEEVTWQVFLTLGAGHEPTANLISNALSRILGNPAYYSTLTSGARPVMDAVMEVLRYETPLSNYGVHFARRSMSFHGMWLQAAVPIIISFGAMGHFSERDHAGTHHPHDASHLSWGAGPHSCPVKQPALLIATEAVERLTQWLPDLRPTVARERLQWRPGPFHRSLTALPVRFTARVPDQAGDRA
ncbi:MULTISPECIES: cytochrome P450 [unclassified Streptomyces]|uniref:cytochrome P450 n=1 Tax=unclassified Streptomyces TaxID=2593676 RepID=UPI001371D923|nr:cytochrome P450 [Streptomyces sp. SHP 1-2]MCW5251761.1 cytochrome P450 [Streptomyces sp. SHP 1-2]MYU22258.1 cytochrome P450 [Streptomyces sp. SID8352]